MHVLLDHIGSIGFETAVDQTWLDGQHDGIYLLVVLQ
jgi:hypothetical protein